MERADLEQWKAREVARLLALVETERRYYQEIIASMPVGLLVLSSDLAIVSANRHIRRIFGLRSGDSLRGRLDTLLPAWALERAQEVLSTGNARTGLMVDTERNGGRRLRVGILAIRNWDEEAEQEALVTIEDVTGLEAGEPPGLAPLAAQPLFEPAGFRAALPASELIDNLDAVIWAAEAPEMNFVFVGGRAADELGYSAERWLNSPGFWKERIHPADRERISKLYENALANPGEAGGGVRCEYRALTRDGRWLWLREHARAIAGEDGAVRHIAAVAVNVTERRRLEEQLVQGQRVEAAAKLASRLAHDLNNMLMIVTGYGEELLAGIPAANPLSADVREIVTATARLGGLTNQLLAFTRRQAVAPAAVDVAAALRRMEPSLEETLGTGYELRIESEPEGLEVGADAAQLADTVMALARHARESLAGGKVSVRASRVEIREDLHSADATLRPGWYGAIGLEYGGAPEAEPRGLFESFLAAREGGEESGPALARAYASVRQWGGDISVEESDDGRTAMRILLPLASGEMRTEAARGPAARQTVLVVEDESGIRALVSKILRRQGFEVLDAANGEEAVAMCGAHEGEIDLLITDVIMPAMGGPELVERLRRQRPPMKVLYVSGYSDVPAVYSESLPPGTAFLQKPFTLGALLSKVREVLAAKPDA